MFMPMSLESIHKLEYIYDYPAAIDELELRLKENPNEAETIIRLGFNLWYAVVENDCMGKNLPVKQYASRFMALFSQYRDTLKDNADFCWAFGQGIQMFWFYFPGATEKQGQSLIDNACNLDNFYRRFFKDLPRNEIAKRFKGRGILDIYYGRGVSYSVHKNKNHGLSLAKNREDYSLNQKAMALSAFIRKEQEFQIFIRGRNGEWETYTPSAHGPAESITKGYAVAYANGELLEYCDNGSDLPPWTNFIYTIPYKVVKMPECAADARVSIVHEPSAYRQDGYYCTKLTNNSDAPFKVNRFAAFSKKGFFGGYRLSTISHDWFSHEQFLYWYNTRSEWIRPGTTVADQDNYGFGNGYWVFEIEFKNQEIVFVKSRLPDKKF